jgi:hypothetical protein
MSRLRTLLQALAGLPDETTQDITAETLLLQRLAAAELERDQAQRDATEATLRAERAEKDRDHALARVTDAAATSSYWRGRAQQAEAKADAQAARRIPPIQVAADEEALVIRDPASNAVIGKHSACSRAREECLRDQETLQRLQKQLSEQGGGQATGERPRGW